MSDEKSELQRQIRETLDRLGHRLNGRAVTVAMIGTVGVGKSSLINTIATAMSKTNWQEHAFTGHHGTRAEPVTAYTRRYPQCCREEEHKNPLMPTLLDIGGLPNQLDEYWGEVLNMVFYGRIPENENLVDVHNYVKSEGKILLPRYNTTYEELKVDRVLVVAAATEALPESLLETVVRAARPLQGPCKRSIPIFGVMTKIDLLDMEVDQTFKIREENFREILGLKGVGNRYQRCINYCSDMDPDNRRIRTSDPTLDIPVLTLMTQICDPAIEVVNQRQHYPFHSRVTEYLFGLAVVFVALIAFLLRYFAIL